ncbi:hypothetical protein Cyrtocomes_00411 [Candidatus Cyrtobacter comes]|uniref:Uncharacterized protein n=1 Tax=Candidatus Cyrtobacter comes TaxID=675776 RepID=A0ABU5L7F1_9RICK|nr:hypothetical protein [Candidatus Cyrtobacter comes]
MIEALQELGAKHFLIFLVDLMEKMGTPLIEIKG